MSKIYDLTCEYKKNPMQIDIMKPRFSWKIASDDKNITQVSWQFEVINSRTDNTVWIKEENSNRTVHICYDGEQLEANTRYYVRVSSILSNGETVGSDGTDYFETGIFDKSEWNGIWIGKKDREKKDPLGNCPMFRKTITLDKDLIRAKIFISARGLYELSVNGKALDEYVLSPGWTKYDKRQQYLSYDATDIFKEGKNCVGVRLGDGWFNGDISFNHQKHVYGDTISFASIIILEYTDRTETVKTDETWKVSESGILKSSIYDGEMYDLTKEDSGWSLPEYDDGNWAFADIMKDSQALITGMVNEGTKRIETIKPIGIINAPNGDVLIDMGQNMTGWARITIDAKEGDRIHIKHAETLDKDGNFYSGNLRLAKQEDTYILRDGKNILEPHFTFHGFRYIKVVEFPKEISLDCFEGIVLHTAMEPLMKFECSDELVNKLWHNLTWGQKDNFLDVPTDCPQRDERLGWTGDAQIFAKTACYNFGADSFFTKWLYDVMAEQYQNGAIPFVVPDVLPKDWRFSMEAGLGWEHTSAAWADAITIIPWTLYECYGDKRILEEAYDSMKRYISYIYNGAHNGSGNPYIWDWGPQLGDWLGLDSEEGSYRGGTDEQYVATAYYAYSTNITAKCARILNNSEDADYYEQLYLKIVESFKAKYIKNDEITIKTQTAQILPLCFGLLNEGEEKIAADILVNMLKENNNHLKTGFVGTPYLCNVLSKYGHSDMAYTLLMQKDFPSWLYQVTQGATTVWEHWDGKKPDGTFWSDNMNSFNHYAYGSIGEWLYRSVAGIDTDENKPGFEHIIIKPVSDKSLKYVNCSYASIRGRIVSNWSRENDSLSLHIEIPANTTATVYLEDGSVFDIGSGSHDYNIGCK